MEDRFLKKQALYLIFRTSYKLTLSSYVFLASINYNISMLSRLIDLVKCRRSINFWSVGSSLLHVNVTMIILEKLILVKTFLLGLIITIICDKMHYNISVCIICILSFDHG